LHDAERLALPLSIVRHCHRTPSFRLTASGFSTSSALCLSYGLQLLESIKQKGNTLAPVVEAKMRKT